jgi:hypothetical protein
MRAVTLLQFRSAAATLLGLCLFGVLGCNPAPDAPDAASPSDAGVDAFVACTSAAQCDDGLFCTGVEACVDGACVPGIAMACDDGAACTRDACSESLRRCVSSVPDADGDGAADAACLDGSGTPLGDDCADDDANRFPDNAEVCDALGHDEDCDDTTLGAVDSDGDGHVDARCCNGASCGDDCNDGARGASPEATEVCNGIDDDCDTRTDEGVAIAGFEDHDHDGYGDVAHPTTACGSAAGFSVYSTDCDDDDVSRSPGQGEICDLQDNDCDANVDESATAVVWYRDLDGDGFGSAPSGTTTSCTPPTGYSLLGTDCNDTTSSVGPGAAEVCNAVDDDCSGSADYAIAAGDLEDDDGDGLADVGCGLPRGVDCDDRDALTGAGSIETCDGRDNDCDTRVDEDATTLTFFRDLDGDGYGSSASGATLACTAPAGFARRSGDCDDANATRRPGGTEGCNATDDDCDGAVDEGSAAAMCAGTPHALATCLVGHCVVIDCEAGFQSCDVLAPDCETNVASDPASCGACGHRCSAGQSCSEGVCGPTLAATFLSSGMDPDGVRAIATDPSGDYYFTGVIGSEAFIGGMVIGGDYAGNVVVARVGRDGALRWLVTFGSSGQLDQGNAIVLTSSGLWVAGLSRSVSISFGSDTFTPGDTRFHAFVTRLDPASGIVQPGTVFLSSSVDVRLDGLAASGSRVVAVGGMSGAITVPVTGDVHTAVGFDAIALGLAEATGTPVWSSFAGGSQPDAWISATALASGRVVAVGQSLGAFTFGAATSVARGGYDIVLGDLDPATGAAGWLAYDGGAGDDLPTGIAPSGTTVVVSGHTVSATGAFGAAAGGIDAILAQHSATTGSAIRTARFGSAGTDRANAIAIDAAGNLYVAGVLGGAVDFGRGLVGASGDSFLGSFDGALAARFSVTEPTGTATGAAAVAIASDGHRFVGGSSTGGFFIGHIWVSRYAP